MSKFSGFRKLQWADAGTSFGTPVDIELVSEDGTENTVELPEDDKITHKGQPLYAGVRETNTFNCYDLSKFAALETKMKANAAIDVRLVDPEGNNQTVALDVIPMVHKPKKYATGRLNTFVLKITNFIV